MIEPTGARPSVLFVTKRLAVGGAERHLVQIIPALRSNGIAVALFVLERGGELERALRGADVAIEGIKAEGPRWLNLVRAGWALIRCIRNRRPDVVHFFLPEAYLVGGAAAMLAGHRCCMMSRRSLSHYQRGRPWLARLERLMHRRMVALLGNSQAVVDELAAEVGERSRIGLIHNGVAIPPNLSDGARSRVRRELALGDEVMVMIIVANLIPYKGHADLIAALARVAPELPPSWRLLAVGRDEGIGAALKAQAVDNGIAERISWLGARDDVEAILPAADLALLVSHQEGFSNALLEEMAQGLAVIATEVGGNRDAIIDGQSGRLVPVGDPARLGDAILELVGDATSRRRLGLAARQRVIARFSTDACIERYLRLYKGFAELGKWPVQAIIDGAAPIQS